jgi:hypothetical protein
MKIGRTFLTPLWLQRTEKHGQDLGACDYIASKNHNHSQLNPYSQVGSNSDSSMILL